MSKPPPDDTSGTLVLIVNRQIRAPIERVFAAWTDPSHLEAWWGPAGVQCIDPAIDLRVGGAYQLGNRLPDGKVVWIRGVFEVVTPPTELVYSWQVEPGEHPRERVRVQFAAVGSETRVTVVHERIRDQATHDDHAHGWAGCFDGLVAFCEGASELP